MPRYDICPKCGNQKRSVAKTCKFCQSQPQNSNQNRNRIDYSILSDTWLAEFRGLFFGEGSTMIARNNSSYTPILAIRLRDDDLPMIQEIQRVLGGRFLRSNKHERNPLHGNQVEWRVSNLDHAAEICTLLLKDTHLPAKKTKDIQAVLDFCNWRKSTGRYSLTDEDRHEADRRIKELRELRMYL